MPGESGKKGRQLNLRLRRGNPLHDEILDWVEGLPQLPSGRRQRVQTFLEDALVEYVRNHPWENKGAQCAVAETKAAGVIRPREEEASPRDDVPQNQKEPASGSTDVSQSDGLPQDEAHRRELAASARAIGATWGSGSRKV
jgi:hypothetical protein